MLAFSKICFDGEKKKPVRIAGAGPAVNGGGTGEGTGLLLWKTQRYRGGVLISSELDN